MVVAAVAVPAASVTTSARAVVTGLAVAELLRGATYLVFPTVILGAAFAHTVSAPLPTLSIVLTVTALLLSADVVGYAIGLGGVTLVATSPFVARYKTVLGVSLGVLLMVPIFAVSSGSVDTSILAGLPVAWYADLLVAGSPVQPSVPRALGAVVVTVVLVGLAGRATVGLAERYWYSDPATTESPRGAPVSPSETATPLEAALYPLRLSVLIPDTPARTIAAKALVQTVRNPGKLSFALVPVIVAVPTVVNAFGAGTRWEMLLAVSLVGIPWLSGVAFGLNPLGDEGKVLPATLATTISGQAYVRGIATL